MHDRTPQDRRLKLGCGVLSHEQSASTPLRAQRLGLLLLVSALGLAAACSGDSSPGTVAGSGGSGGAGTGAAGGGGTGGGGNTDSSTECALRTDYPIDRYVANMTKKGKNGITSFQLIQSDPGPPVFGNNVWKLKVTGADGMPVTQGLVVEVFMPDHVHNSPIPPTITYDAASGIYGLDPMYLSMVGMWRVTFKITDPNDSSLVIDKVEFFFCVA